MRPEGKNNRMNDHKEDGLLGIVLGLLVLAVIAVIAVVLLVNGTASDSAKKDVAVTSCRSTDGGRPTAAGTILNHSSKSSNYVIRLEFRDAQGNTVSEGGTGVADVAAKGTAKWNLTGARDVKGAVKCEVTTVSRTHVPGQ